MNICTIRNSIRCLWSVHSKSFQFYQSANRLSFNQCSIAANQYASWSAQINNKTERLHRNHVYCHWPLNNLDCYGSRNFITTIKSNSQAALKAKSLDGTNVSRKISSTDGKTQTKNGKKSVEQTKSPEASPSSTQPASDDAPKPESDEPEEKLSLTAKFKKMYKEYWYVLLPVHIVTSCVWMGGFYYLSTSGVDIPSVLQSLHFSETVITKLKDSSMGHWAIAYMCYKIATPARYTVTLGGTTVTIKYLSQWGYIKPVPSKEKLKQMYDDQKAKFQQKN